MTMKKIIIGIAVFLILVGGFFAITRMQDRSTTSSNPARVYHIGFLARGRGSYEVAIKGFQDRLKELGYVDGQNVIYDVRYLSTKDELDKAAQDFVNAGVDLINTYSTPASQAAYRATQKMPNPIPIVFASLSDPVAAGIVKSIEKPGTNVTGVTSLSAELTGKRIELLNRIVPGIKKIAMPRSALELNDPSANRSVAVAQEEAKKLGIELVFFTVRTKEEIVPTLAGITSERVQGMIIGGDSLIWGSLDDYVKQAIKEKLPLGVFDTDQVKRGGLIGFGPDYALSGGQAGTIAHQILQGKKPEEIPIEVPNKFQLTINLNTARAIGVTLDPQLLKEAEVIIGK